MPQPKAARQLTAAEWNEEAHAVIAALETVVWDAWRICHERFVERLVWNTTVSDSEHNRAPALITNKLSDIQTSLSEAATQTTELRKMFEFMETAHK